MAERTHVVVDPRDNISTLLDARVQLDRLRGGLALATGIPFGHKVALTAIARGEAVIKYGVTIGHATDNIESGAHVHVHNCA